jgi:Stress up-regulated Nod 19
VVQYDMVNYSEVTQKIYINLEYEYKNNQNGKNAGHTLKSVTCNGAIPPRVSATGPAVTTSMPMYVKSNATIVWARGHLHSGGIKMLLNVNGRTICTSLPKYNNNGVITTMSLCPEPIPLSSGQYVTISSEYDLTKHKL